LHCNAKSTRFTAIPGEEKKRLGVRGARHTRLFIVEIAGETQRFRVYTATLSRRGRRRIGLRFDGPQGSVTIELSLVTFWQLTETFHEQSIAKQD